ncbi:MAG: hypothetical protein N2450_09760 [bacterium]|nr:hypothetical protein [bacterium]
MARSEYLKEYYSDSTNIKLIVKIFDTYYLQNDFQNAINWIEFSQKNVSDSALLTLRVLKSLSFYKLGKYFDTEVQLKSLLYELEKKRNSIINDTVYFYLGLSLIQQLKVDEAKLMFNNIRDQSKYYKLATSFIQKINQMPKIQKKSKTLSTLLAVIPGLGYAYSEHYHTAISAMVVITAFSIMTIRSYELNNKPVAYFTGFLSSAWYIGSLYGSYNAADRMNKKRENDFKSHFYEPLEERNHK